MALKLLAVALLGLYGPVRGTNCPDRWVAYDGSCYLFGHEEMHFTEAEEYCRHHGAHLVHVNSQQENTFLRTYLRNLKNANYWLGMMDETVEGIWKWYDTDTKVTFTDWNTDEPNNYKNEDCAVLHADADYKWVDLPCEHGQPGIKGQTGQHALCETSFGEIGIFG